MFRHLFDRKAVSESESESELRVEVSGTGIKTEGVVLVRDGERGAVTVETVTG